MNQGIAILIGIFVVGFSYFVCAHVRHGSCDMGKLFSVLVVVVSFVTGAYLCIHAVELALAGQKDDAAWVGVAAFVLTAFSCQQAIIMFRELFAKKVAPTKLTEKEKERLEV
jgi:hypothetical protein